MQDQKLREVDPEADCSHRSRRGRPARARIDSAAPPINIEVVNRGGVSASASEYAENRLAQIVDTIPASVKCARIKLAQAPHARAMIAAHVEATIVLENTGTVRVHAGAQSLTAAVDQAMSRLVAKLDRTSRRSLSGRQAASPDPNTWPDRNRPVPDVPGPNRPPEDRRIVREKILTAPPMTIEEAAWDADLMAIDLFLFTEATSGRDCLLERSDDAYNLYGLDLPAQTLGTTMGTMNITDQALPTEQLDDAVAELNCTDRSYRFFTSEESGRASVLYRRHDGHYGLVRFE